jgi:hypothetical protein
MEGWKLLAPGWRCRDAAYETTTGATPQIGEGMPEAQTAGLTAIMEGRSSGVPGPIGRFLVRGFWSTQEGSHPYGRRPHRWPGLLRLGRCERRLKESQPTEHRARSESGATPTSPNQTAGQ